MVEPVLKFVRSECTELTPTLDSNLVRSCLNLFESLGLSVPSDNRKIFNALIFSVTWTVAGAINEASRQKFDQFFRKLLSEKFPAYDKPPLTHMLHDQQYDVAENKWKPWSDYISTAPIPANMKYEEIVVPTIDTVRYSYLFRKLLTNDKHVLVVGPTGTGKSLYIKNSLSQLDKDKFVSILISFSAQTSAKQTQDILEGKFDKRRKGVYGPPTGKRAVVFVDDVSMPAKEQYGAQPPIELLRQFLDHGGWYNLKENTFQDIVDVQLIGAMGPAGGGRNTVTSRVRPSFSSQ